MDAATAQNEEWKTYPGAPGMGTPLCSLADLQAKGMLSLSVEGERGGFPLILLFLRSGEPRAFVNACPHQYLPLDYMGPNILSGDGERLICASHGAVFSVDDGTCLDGPAMGCTLAGIPLVVDDSGIVRVG